MATLDLLANFAKTTVSNGGTTAPAAGTSEQWTVASPALFPAASNTANPQTQFRVVDAADPSAQPEIMIVTNVNGTTWTVTRGAENSTPVAHASGFTAELVITDGALRGRFMLATASVGGVALASIPSKGQGGSAGIAVNVGSVTVTVPASGNLEITVTTQCGAGSGVTLALALGTAATGTSLGSLGTVYGGQGASPGSGSSTLVLTGQTPGAALTIFLTMTPSSATTSSNTFIGMAVRTA